MASCSDSGRHPLLVVLGPAGAGKTQHCLEKLRSVKGRALLLVPSRDYADRARKRLAALDPDADGAAIVPFAEAMKAIAKELQPSAEPIRRSQQWLILSDLFEETLSEGGSTGFFGRMGDAPSFIPALAESIRDLKLSGVGPADLRSAGAALAAAAAALAAAAAAPTPAPPAPAPPAPAPQAPAPAPPAPAPSHHWLLSDPALRSKTEAVGALFERYQRFLELNGLLDEEDVFSLALSAIEKSKDKESPKTVLVDGFYRLSTSWRRILAAYSRRGAVVTVTLPGEKSRPLLFAAPLRTLESLKEELGAEERWLEPKKSSSPSALQALERNLFRSVPIAYARLLDAETPRPPVVLFDAPNAYSEVEMAARELVREHDRHGVEWSDCLIVVRSIGDYEALLSGLLSRYDVPFAFRRGRPLTENAAVRSLVQLMRVYLGGWKREDVIEFLRADPIRISGIGVDVARVIARSRGARQGRAAWEGLLDRLKEANERAGAALLQMLDLEHRFPTREEPFGRFADGVRAAVLAFGLDEPSGHSDPEREDRLAIKLALDGLQQMEKQARISDSPPATFARHFRRLQALWRSLTFMPSEPARAVSIIEPYDAQQLRPRVVCVLGMTERVFPRRIKEDPFFQDDERDLLRRHASLDLEPQRERADDERLLFYMAATIPTERLILSMPRSSEESDTLPSFFLSEARTALEAAGESLPAVVRMLADVAPSEEDCVSGHDRILAAADAARELDEDAEAPRPIADIIETRNRPPLPALKEDSVARYAARRRYSVTEIETYNRCPLQHFFKYGLKLRVEADGAGHADRGALHHDTLRQTLRTWAASGDAVEKRKLYESMVKQMVDCLNERSVDAKPHRKALMERAVRGALEVCAEREERYRDIFQMSPAHFELAFGMEDREDEEGRRRDYDAASKPDPLVFADDNGEPVHLCGAIDRVDLASDGRTAMVLDYKMGGTTDWAEIKDGTSIQIPVYLMAVEQIWDFVGAVGCYDSPRDSGRRRFFRKDLVDARAFQPLPGVEDGRLAKPVGNDEYAQALDAARQTVRSAVAGMRAGHILPKPGEHCRFCDYTDACRTTPDGTHDGEPIPAR